MSDGDYDDLLLDSLSVNSLIWAVEDHQQKYESTCHMPIHTHYSLETKFVETESAILFSNQNGTKTWNILEECVGVLLLFLSV